MKQRTLKNVIRVEDYQVITDIEEFRQHLIKNAVAINNGLINQVQKKMMHLAIKEGRHADADAIRSENRVYV